MKLRYFITLPLVALLASCNSAGDSSAAKVKQKLPSDEKVVAEDSEDYADCAGAIFAGVLETAFYVQNTLLHFGVDVDTKVSIKSEGITSNNSVNIHGAVNVGYAQTGTTLVHETAYPMYGGFIEAKFNTLKAHVEIPVVEYVYDENDNIVDYTQKIEKMDFNFNGLSCTVVVNETEDGAIMYLDASNHALQDFIVAMLELSGMPAESVEPESEDEDYIIGYNDVLDAILGAAGEDGYRQGKVQVDISALLIAFLTKVEAFATLVDYFNYPFYEFYNMAVMGIIMESGIDFEQILTTVVAMFPVLGAKIGIKLDEEENATKVSAVLNSSVKDMVKKFAGDDAEEVLKEMPVSGNFGILVTVGTETGSEEFLALQQFIAALALKISYSIKDNEGKVMTSISGNVDFKFTIDASYGEGVEVPTISASEAETYRDDTMIVGILISMLLPAPEADPEVR